MQQKLPQTVAGSAFTPELQEQAHKTFGAAQTYLQAQLAPATLRAYTEACGHFAKWCAVRGLESLPANPESIALYVSELAQAGKRASTLTKALAAIRFAHKTRNLGSPTEHPLVTGIMSGIRRVHGSEPVSQKRPLQATQVQQMLLACPKTLTGLRDRAILALGFAGAFRRSELAALNVDDLSFHADGHLTCRIRRSKTDKAGKGAVKAILNGQKLMPVYQVSTWLDAAGIREGPVFRRMDWAGGATESRLSSKWVGRVVQRYAHAAGVDARQVGAHSLRSGFITTAAEHQVPLYRIMEVTLQTSAETTLKYMRRANLFRDHAGSDFL
jgi:site-specific recombinase XerD